MEAYGFTTPQKIQAGFVGERAFHFDCAGSSCSAPTAAVIAGVVSNGPPVPGWGNVVVKAADAADPGRLAFYCAPCFAEVIAATDEETTAAAA